MRRNTVLMALLLFAGVLVVSAAPATAAEQCTTNAYASDKEAQANFKKDCGQPFQETTKFGCTWVPEGWVCTGPGTKQASGSSSPSNPSGGSDSSRSVEAPKITEAGYNGEYVNVVWQNAANTRGVNVYRNGAFQGSISTPNTVFNDYKGQDGDVYHVSAYGNPKQKYIKSNTLRADVSAVSPMKNVKAKQVGSSRVDITWDRGSGSIGGWRVYRNGKFMRDRRADGRTIMVDYNSAADQISYYEVQAFTWDRNRKAVFGPKTLVISPILEGAQRSHPDPSVVTGSSTASNQHAAAANAATATAQRERDEANNAVKVFAATAALAVAVPGAATKIPMAFAGAKAFQEIGQAEHAEKVAKEKMDRYESCMSSSCAFDDPDDKPGYIPGTNTPGGCSEGGCWPA